MQFKGAVKVSRGQVSLHLEIKTTELLKVKTRQKYFKRRRSISYFHERVFLDLRPDIYWLEIKHNEIESTSFVIMLDSRVYRTFSVLL